MRELLALNHYFIRYKKQMAAGVVFLTVANLFLVIIPVLIRKALDNVEAVVQSTKKMVSSYVEVLFTSDVAWMLAWPALVLVLAVVGYGYLLFLTRQTIIVASRHIEFDIRNELYAHLQKLPYSYFLTHKTGDIYVRVTEDINRVREYFGPAFMYMVNTITRSGIIIGMMLWVNPKLTLWALLPTPLLSFTAYALSGYINRLSKQIQEQYAQMAGIVTETFSSVRLIKAYVRQKNEADKFEAEAQRYRERKLKLSAVDALFYPLLNFLIGFSVVFVVWKGGVLIQTGEATVGNIAEFIIYVIYLTWPVASLGYTINLIQRSAASNKRIQDFLNEKTVQQETEQTEQTETGDSVLGKITFNKVSYTYPGSVTPALKDVSVTLHAGERIGIVGRTGSGKTTFAHLVAQLIEPQSGEIYIDDKSIKSWSLAEIRKIMGYVPQENFLFSDTIRENIAFGKKAANQHEVTDAAAHAQLLENILSFEKQFETMLGERGITLSGGQKQRTGIARALIRKPRILILDDSLSAVDTKTEEAIVKYIQSDLNKTTTLMISHRISSVQHCHTIIVLDNGTVAEKGTHEELLSLNGIYNDMYRRQMLENELSTL